MTDIYAMIEVHGEAMAAFQAIARSGCAAAQLTARRRYWQRTRRLPTDHREYGVRVRWTLPHDAH